MPAVALEGRPQDPGFANLTQKIVQMVMTSATRASVAESGVQTARLPQDPKSLEYVFSQLFKGSGPRARQLRRAFGRPRARAAGLLPAIDFLDNRSVIEQAMAGSALNAVQIAPASFSGWRPGRSQQEITELITKTLRFRRLPSLNGAATPQPASPKAKELQLKIARVQCVQRVGWEATDWDGKDVILCGGLGFDSTLASPRTQVARVTHILGRSQSLPLALSQLMATFITLTRTGSFANGI